MSGKPNWFKGTEIDKAYLAGLFDGEGSISVLLNKGSFRYRIYIGMTDELLIAWVHHIIGLGHVYKEQRGSWKEIFIWTICKRVDILEFLNMLEPYLKQKQGKARIMIDLLKSRLSRRSRHGGNSTHLNLAEKQAIAILRAMNKRGINEEKNTSVVR